MIRSITAVIVAAILGFGAGPAVAATHAPPVPDGAPRTRSSSGSGSGVLGPYAGNPVVAVDACSSGRPGRRVSIIGDSITVRSFDQTVRRLAAVGADVCANAQAARPTAPSVDALLVPPMVDADVWVVATGSNDIFDPAAFPAQVARVLHAAQGRPVVWVNVFVHRWRVSAAMRVADLRNSRRLNAVLARAAESHPNLTIVDWSGYLTAGPSRERAYLVDGVHPNDGGQRVRAILVAAAVAPRLAA